MTYRTKTSRENTDVNIEYLVVTPCDVNDTVYVLLMYTNTRVSSSFYCLHIGILTLWNSGPLFHWGVPKVN